MSIREDEFDGRPELVKKRAHSILLQRLAISVIAIFIISAEVLLVLNALSSFKSRDVLLDCTQPTGDCAQQSQEQTATIIKKLIDSGQAGDVATQRIVVLAAACSEEPSIKSEPDRFTRITLLEECVNDQLKVDKENR